MNKLDKILICIIVILVIVLSCITFQYFKMKETAQNNLQDYLNTKQELYLLQHPDATTNENN